MAVAKEAWGIDIGQCALKALKLRQVGERVEVVAFELINHPQILSQPEADSAGLIRAALEKLLSRHELAGAAVAVGVPGHQTFSRFTKLPPVEPKKVPDIVRFEARQQIPFDIDEVNWDYQTFTSPDSPDVEVGIFAMRRDLIRQHLAALTAAKIQPAIVQAAPLALYNFLRYDGLCGPGGTMLVDIGAENTDLIITDGRTVWSRNIPLGGNNFTEALVKSFKLSFPKAENLKRTAATSKYARQIFQAMRPVFADLVAEIQRSMGFYSSTHRDVAIEQMLGMGNAFRLPGLQKYLQQNLQLDVQRVASFNKLSVAGQVNAAQFGEQVLTLGVAYGLAVQALGLAQVNSNLLPTELARAVMWRKKRPWFAAAAACLLASAAVLWGRNVIDRTALARNAGNAEAVSIGSVQQAARLVKSGVDENLAPREYAAYWLAAAQAFQKEWSRISSVVPQKQQQIKAITSLVDSATLWPKILAVVHESLPRPQPVIANATGPQELRHNANRPGRGKRLPPRSERRQIFIESFQANYTPDVYAALQGQSGMLTRRQTFGPNSPNIGRERGLMQAGPTRTQPPRPGFVATMQLRTPHRNGAGFVNQTLVANLRQKGRQPGLGFYIDRVRITSGGQIGSGAGMQSRRRASGTMLGRGQRAARPTMQPSARRVIEEDSPKVLRSGRTSIASGVSTGPEQTGLIDPVTGESMAEDYRFTMEFAVVLGEPGAEPPTGAAQAGPARSLRP
ncbi:MAG: type IV pilus assembly protein PilM, partial [Phycisphaerae bacterium]